MCAIDFRNETFEGLTSRLESLRRQAYEAWIQHGPGTTREIAQKSGMSLLTLRPRSTELLSMGLITIAGRSKTPGRATEGIYQVTSPDEWDEWRREQMGEPLVQQTLI